MYKRRFKKVLASVLAASMVISLPLPAGVRTVSKAASSDFKDEYAQRFKELYDELHDTSNGYFSQEGIPYHSIETLMVEAPDYGHVTTSEAFSYYMWLEAEYAKYTGDFDGFRTSWDIAEKYIIPSGQNQPESAMSRYDPSKPATYAPEWELPEKYPAKLDSSAAVGRDPISAELKNAYNQSSIYGMHWLLDVDNWYGYGNRGDKTSRASYINTFQRGKQESTWETIPQPCYDTLKMGGKNGYLDLFTGDNSYSAQFKYTNAPDADARAVQATYWAQQYAKKSGADISKYVSKASKMGDYLRYSMFDKYFRKIGQPNSAGNGYDACHYLMSWYYAWGGGVGADWSWVIGCSHSHFGYQNPMAAWVLSTDSDFKPISTNGASDWAKSLKRQVELYQWLQSSEGGIAGGVSNSKNGRYEQWGSDEATFYGMGYEPHPVYADPGSNEWFGMQAWSMQRMAEYYYLSKDADAGRLLEKWANWVKSVVNIYPDKFEIPNKLTWTGQPDTWTGTPSDNSNLHVSVKTVGEDLGVAGSLSNALLYYAKTSGDDEARQLAKDLLDCIWKNYRDDKGVSVPEVRDDYHRFFDQEVYVPEGWQGTMPNGDVIKSGVKFIDIRSKYKDDPNWSIVEEAYKNGVNPTLTYHRFWAQCDVAIANAVYSSLFEDGTGNVTPGETGITPTEATYNKKNPTTINVSLSLNNNDLFIILNGNKLIKEGKDYNVVNGTVVFNNTYLNGLATGDKTFTFIFDDYVEKEFILHVVDKDTTGGGGDIPDDPDPVITGDVKVEFTNVDTNASTNQITPRLKLTNTGSTNVDLSNIKIRYYFTADSSASSNFFCDYCSAGTGNVTGTVIKMNSAKTGADSYIEIGFSSAAGTLAAGQTIDVMTRIAKSDWTNYTQTNDYSFNDNTKVAVYVGTQLQWGMEPK